jgi:cysteine-rich repeat protein
VPRDCAVENKCLAGYCNAGSGGACETTAVSCDDSNLCTDDSCDPTFGCTHSPTLTPPEPAEASCTDTADNDCDGDVDAADSDCWFCGDGVVQAAEECDDGNTNPFDGCDDCILVDINPD